MQIYAENDEITNQIIDSNGFRQLLTEASALRGQISQIISVESCKF